MGNNSLAVIKVVGVGGGGSNAVNRMIEAGLKGVEFVAINTDQQDLVKSNADVKLDIGREKTRGLGAGADPEVGRQSAEDHIDEIEAAIQGSDMVFITAGEGGGTGTGAAPVVAKIAKSNGALTIGVVTRPFSFEAPRRAAHADQGIHRLREEVDALIIVPNDRLLEVLEPGVSMLDAFAHADNVLLAGVKGITDLITTPGLINLDFADVKSVMQGAGSALMGIGSARGADRAIKAAELAISSPLLEASIDGAHGVLLSIQGSSNLGLAEISEAARLVQQAVHEEANIIFGTVIDDALGDDVRVIVIAAGFDEHQQKETGRRAAPRYSVTEAERAENIRENVAAAPAPANNQAETQAPSQAHQTVAAAQAATPATGGYPNLSQPQQPLERHISDPAFEIDDDDELDIPDFLK